MTSKEINKGIDFKIQLLNEAGLSGSCLASVNSNYVKLEFLKMTRGKNRQYYDLTKYAQQIIEQNVAEYLTKESKKNLLSVTSEIKDQDISLNTRIERIEMEVKWEALPEVPQINLDDFKLEQIKTNPSQDFHDEVLTSVLRNYSSHKIVEGQIQSGDYVKTLWSTEGESPEEQVICIGQQPRLPQDLEEKILASKSGDLVEYSMEIPKNFKNLPLPPKYIREISSLAGKGIILEIRISEVKRSIPPTADELVARGIFKSLEDLNTHIQNIIENHISRININYGMKQLRDFLSSINFEVPSSEAEKYSSFMERQMNFDSTVESLTALNEQLGSAMTLEEAKQEFRVVAGKILRGDYIAYRLPSLINLQQKRIDSLILAKLMSMDLKGRSSKEIRNTLSHYRSSWTIEIILEEAVKYLKTEGKYSEKQVPWDEVEFLGDMDPMYLRYFSTYVHNKKNVSTGEKNKVEILSQDPNEEDKVPTKKTKKKVEKTKE